MKAYAAMILLLAVSAHAADKPYVRILPVAYWNGIDKEPTPVGMALPLGTICDKKLTEQIKADQRIPEEVTVACKAWTPKSPEDNL